MEINFNKVRNRINTTLIESIKNGGSEFCTVCVYILSLMFETPFDLKEVNDYFENNPKTNNSIQKYMKAKGVNFFCVDNQNSCRQVTYADIDVLPRNGIAVTLSGNIRVPEGKFYTTSVLDEKGCMFYMRDGFRDMNKVMDKYICFYSKSENISKFVTFTDDKETVQA